MSERNFQADAWTAKNGMRGRGMYDFLYFLSGASLVFALIVCLVLVPQFLVGAGRVDIGPVLALLACSIIADLVARAIQ